MISMLPLADIEGLIGFIVFVVIMIVSAISQAAGNKKQAPPRPRPRPPVRPAQGGQGQPQAGGKRPGPVAQELEDFLRRAAGGQQPARQQQPPRPPQARPAARPPQGRPVVAQPVAAAEVIDDLEIVESVADHVSHSVGHLDEPVEDEVSRKFDHRMGQLGSRDAQAVHDAAIVEPEHGADAYVEHLPPTAAAGLAAMLGSSASLRQAILLSEIINRPEHRWS